MESFLEKFLERRLEDTTPDTSSESGCGSEPHWCETNLPRSETGGPHENCHSWQMDCPCTCAALPEPAADAAPEDAQQEIEQKHEQEAQEGAEESHEPPEHRGEEAFVSAMAHTLLVKRSEVDILNIISRDIQVVNQEDSSVIKTTPGIEIEFGVRFVEGAEEQQKLVAEKIRSMNLGCQYMFSGRLHCDADTQKQIERERAENAQGANRGQAPQHRRNLKESQMREQQSEDPEHKAVVNLEAQDGESTAADKQEVDLMVELRWALSTELRNSGMKVPDDFSIVAMEKPMVVLFSNGEDEEQQQQQQQIQQQPMGYYQNPQGYGPPPAKKGLSPGATAAVVLLIFGALGVLMIGLFMKFGKKVSKFNAQEEYGMQQRFDAAKSATSSLSPKTYDHDSPVQSRSALRAVDEDDEEVVDLEQVDSI